MWDNVPIIQAFLTHAEATGHADLLVNEVRAAGAGPFA